MAARRKREKRDLDRFVYGRQKKADSLLTGKLSIVMK